MRFAISAVTAASGLFLLGLAFYGQPAVYLQEAREEWNALVDRQPAEQLADTDTTPPIQTSPERHSSSTEAATKFAMAPSLPQPPDVTPAAPATPPVSWQVPAVPGLATPPREAQTTPVEPQAALPQAPPPAALAAPQQTLPAPTAQTNPSVATAQLAEPAPAIIQPAVPTMLVPDRRHEAASNPVAPAVEPRQPETARAQPVKPEPAKTETARSNMGRTEQTKTEPAQTDSAKPEPARMETAKAELAKTDSAKAEAAAKAVQRQKVALSPPPPLPLPQASSSRQDTEDAQSVLARLRQLGPPPVLPQQADVAPQQPEPRARLIHSPTLPRLTAARAALASGRVENARRLLQEAQLQLVFRPIDSPGDDLPTASKGSADVARALEALSANDVAMSRRYIDLAVDDLAGTTTTASAQQADRRPAGYAPGYAPAYPPR